MYLFNRSISVNVRSDDGRLVTVDGALIDSHHELCLTLKIDSESNRIDAADGELRRAPYSDCGQIQILITQLVGINLMSNVRRQIQSAVGGKKGCTHLTELSLECIKGYIQAKFRLMHTVMSPEDVEVQVEKYLDGSCLHYSKS